MDQFVCRQFSKPRGMFSQRNFEFFKNGSDFRGGSGRSFRAQFADAVIQSTGKHCLDDVGLISRKQYGG